MTSSLALAETVLRNVAASTSMGDLYVPVAASDATGSAELRAYGVIEGDGEFVRGWRFRWPDATVPVLLAFAQGSLKFRPAAGGRPDSLELQFQEPLGEVLRERGAAAWFPRPDRAVYEGIDVNASRALLAAQLEADPLALTSTRTITGLDLTVDQVVDRFFGGQLPGGINTRAGREIGVPAVAGAKRELLFCLTGSDLPDGFTMDPAVYVQHWAEQFANLETHPWSLVLSTPFGGPLQNGTVRYLDPNGTGAPPFTDRFLPGHDPRAVLDVCNPGDSVVVLGSGTFELSTQLVVDRAVTITSIAQRQVSLVPEPPDDLIATLPRFKGTTGRVLWVPATSLGETGIATIAGIRITDGQGEHEADGGFGGETYIHGGGGLLVSGKLAGSNGGYDYDAPARVYVRNCLFEENKVEMQDAAVKVFPSDGFGAGILCHNAGPYLYGNLMRQNASKRRGGAIAVFGYGWPRIEGNEISGNVASDGGGIALEIAFPDAGWLEVLNNIDPSSPLHLSAGWRVGAIARARSREVEIVRNLIRDNAAGDDGGGLYASVLSRFRMVDCDVRGNEAQKGGGGGIRITFASGGTIIGGSVKGNRSNHLGTSFGTERAVSGGGGIALRNGDLFVEGTRIEDNQANGFAGGGIFFNLTTSGNLNGIANVFDIDYDDIREEVFEATNFQLSITGSARIVQNRCTLTPPDGDHRKGGGVYVARIDADTVNDIGYDPPGLLLKIDASIVLAENELALNPAVAGDQISAPGSVQLHVADLVHSVTLDDSALHDGANRIDLNYQSQ